MKPVIVIAAGCLLVSACVGRPFGPATVSEARYRQWSCDQLSQEVVRADGLSQHRKNAITHVMTTKGCIQPLAAETE